MLGLPQMAPIPQPRPLTPAAFGPAAPALPITTPTPEAEPVSSGFQGALGGLGRGLMNFVESPSGNDILQSAFLSMMSSPPTNWLENMPKIYGDISERRVEQDRLAQQQQATEQKRQEELAARNQTATWLKSKFGLSDDEALAAAQNPTILQHYLKQAQGGSDTRFGLTPIYGTDAEGNTVLGVLGDDGSFKAVDTGGVALASGVDKVDLGTHYALLDKRTGQVVGTMPKDNYTPNYDKARAGADGKSDSEEIALYKSMISKMPGLMETVSSLEELADKATYTWAGQLLDEGNRQLGFEPREAAIAKAEYESILDNQILPLLRDTFGAQFTAEEGLRLRKTLGDEKLSPAEKKATLRAFVAQKQRDIEALAARTAAGMGGGQAPSSATPASTSARGGVRAVNPQTGEVVEFDGTKWVPK